MWNTFAGLRVCCFVRSQQIVFQSGFHFTFSPAVNESFYCSPSSPAFGIVSVLDLAILMVLVILMQ